MAGAAGQSDAGFLRKATVTGVATAWPLTWKRENPDNRCSGNFLAWNGQDESPSDTLGGSWEFWGTCASQESVMPCGQVGNYRGCGDCHDEECSTSL